jgi:hypothetical protein
MKDYNIWQMVGIHSWKLAEIKTVLNNSGYLADDIVEVKYDRISNHSAVFLITYDNRYSNAGSGHVYVMPDKNGYLRAEF